MTVLFADIESRGVPKLPSVGVYVYAEHPETSILCFSYALDDGPIRTWYRGAPIPSDLRAAILDPATVWVAHNASFERVMLCGEPGRKFLPPDAHAAFVAGGIGRWECTAARAAFLGLPRSLDGVCRALNLPHQKDAEGHALMLKMCKPLKPRKKRGEPIDPNAPTLWLEDGESIARLGLYCERDVAPERAIYRYLPAMTSTERETWILTEEMNDRGVMVDEQLLLRALFLVEDAEAHLNAKLQKATGYTPAVKANKKLGIAAQKASGAGAVCDHGAITRWLKSLDIEDGEIEGVSKSQVSDLLAREDLPDTVRNVLSMRQEGGKSSAAKYIAILNRMSADGSIKGSLMYCGAPATSRWSGKGVQLQNLPRPGAIKKPMLAIRDMLDGASLREIEAIHGPALVVASELLRPTFIARPGMCLPRGDSKQIEARVLPWLAGANWKLDAFRAYDAGTGPDLYALTAAKVLQVPLQVILDDMEKPNVGALRQASGKTPELACGYEGGLKAFQAMAKVYRQTISDDHAKATVKAWREANPEIVAFWAEASRQAIECVRHRADGTLFPVGQTGAGFKRCPEALILRLPSGHCLFHWFPKIVMKETPWGDIQPAVVHMGNHPKYGWVEIDAYGGMWTAKLTQATARDLMAFWLREAKATGLLHPVLTVHDEGICESPLPADEAASLIESIMRRKPAWAGDLPVSSDSSAGPRYLKA